MRWSKKLTRLACMVCLLVVLGVPMKGMAMVESELTGETAPAVWEEGSGTTIKPFTPEGDATVMDHVTEEQGKEFYTIVTPDENVFYLIIDNQREDNNVYFLDAVTEDDLMSFVKKESEEIIAPTKEVPLPLPELPSEPEVPKEASDSTSSGVPGGGLIVILLAACVAGGLGYYIKIYRPGHELDDAEDIDDFEFEGPEEDIINEDEETEGEETTADMFSDEGDDENDSLDSDDEFFV